MKNTTSPAFSPTTDGRKRSYDIVGDLTVEVRVDANPYGLDPDDLFGMAARINKKRGFLFVSRLLGKHLPVAPSLSLASGAMLGELFAERILGRPAGNADALRGAFASREGADRYYAERMANRIGLEERTLFIGFAETATALGHSMFEAFGGEASFLHTTRENIPWRSSSIDFEEEHSHAVAHRCYVREAELFRGASRIVLVDDEITTGKTALNIIRELQGTFGQTDFVVASLLDWRSLEHRERFADTERELGVTIRCLALLEGSIDVAGAPPEAAADVEGISGCDVAWHRHDLSAMFAHEASSTYLKHTGRFGLTAADGAALDAEVARAAAYLSSVRTGRRALCLGTGEFMYVPMRIAERLGDGAYSQSTTRSPIHPVRKEGYAVRSKVPFVSADGEDVPNFIYNVEPGMYDEAFVFVEREYEAARGASFEDALARIGVPVVHLVFFGGRSGEEEEMA